MSARLSESGVMQNVVSGERDGTMCKLLLECQHVVRLSARGLRIPPRARCPVCKPPTCGATNRDGGACVLVPNHTKFQVQHELNGRRWSYDMRHQVKATG